jgi:hypothetical protein
VFGSCCWRVASESALVVENEPRGRDVGDAPFPILDETLL